MDITQAVLKKLDPWLNNVPDFDDVKQAYQSRGKLQSERTATLRNIESIEEEILTDEKNKPRSNETRIRKLKATQELRDYLTDIEMQLATVENECKLLEFRKSMFSAACYRMKIQWDL